MAVALGGATAFAADSVCPLAMDASRSRGALDRPQPITINKTNRDRIRINKSTIFATGRDLPGVGQASRLS